MINVRQVDLGMPRDSLWGSVGPNGEMFEVQ